MTSLEQFKTYAEMFRFAARRCCALRSPVAAARQCAALRHGTVLHTGVLWYRSNYHGPLRGLRYRSNYKAPLDLGTAAPLHGDVPLYGTIRVFEKRQHTCRTSTKNFSEICQTDLELARAAHFCRCAAKCRFAAQFE